ncbi:isochorismatase family protein [Microvirga soli]|uniref:isochorismatase family protein n=1 Tax=Microvirga soli TaxID=1854496 RepID=UPI00191FD40B|nr:isochorismatase family protein [Microvirga soli]
MERSDQTARQLYEAIKAKPPRPPFGFGKRPAIINVDLQNAYTRVDTYVTAYETNPRQCEYVNVLSSMVRDLRMPVIWTYVAFSPSGADACAWGIRTNTPDSLQNIREGSDRATLDARLQIDRERDFIVNKRMASAFHESPVGSYLTWHQADTVIVTGGSTSGCVRATVVDALSHGYRVVVPEECVSDKHESPHFANLYDMALKYADVVAFEKVRVWLETCNGAER